MLIDTLMYDPGPAAYYTAEMRQAIDDQLPLLRVAASTKQLTIDPMARNKYKGDLYGLLSSMGVPAQLWWPTMRVSKINDRFTVPDNLDYVFVPDQTFLDRLAQAITTTNRLN